MMPFVVAVLLLVLYAVSARPVKWVADRLVLRLGKSKMGRVGTLPLAVLLLVSGFAISLYDLAVVAYTTGLNFSDLVPSSAGELLIPPFLVAALVVGPSLLYIGVRLVRAARA